MELDDLSTDSRAVQLAMIRFCLLSLRLKLGSLCWDVPPWGYARA